MILLAVVGLAVAAALKLSDLRSDKDDEAWARPRQLKALRVDEPGEVGRIVLGRVGSHLVATAQRHSVLVLGATETLKTSGLAVPAILEWPGPVLASSVKADLVRHTLARRQEMGTVWTYDPFATTGLPCTKWSPLSAATTWGGAVRVAEAMCAAAKAKSGGPGGDDFWHNVSTLMLAPLLFAAASTATTFAPLGVADVIRWVRLDDTAEPRKLLRAAGVAEALDAFTANCNRDDRQRSGILTTTETVLGAFADPTVAPSLTGSEITGSDLLDGGAHTLFVCGPSDDQERVEAVFATLVRQILTTAMAKGARAPLDPPLLVVLDEAANIAPVRNLPQLASTAAAHGIQLVSVFQDLAQVEGRYGKAANTVLNNHRAKVFLGGGSDEAALKYVEMLVGEAPLSQSSKTSGDGRDSTTESTTYRSVAPPEYVRQIGPGQGLLIYGHHRPARLALRPWFEDKALTALVEG